MTLDEYLAFEQKSRVRHEYVKGEVFAMSGTTTRHNLIVQNVARGLHAAARPRRCRVFVESIWLRAAEDRMYYPDILVACGAAAEVELIVEQPTLVVEVSSPSTRSTDRREKLDAYRQIPSLRAYLIVAQRHRHVLAYTRSGAGEWQRTELAGAGEVSLDCLGTTLGLDAIYDDVPMPPLTVGEPDPDEVEMDVTEEQFLAEVGDDY